MRCTVYADRKKQWRWRLVSSNGKIIADSGESYANKWNALRAARHMVRVLRTATVKVVETKP